MYLSKKSIKQAEFERCKIQEISLNERNTSLHIFCPRYKKIYFDMALVDSLHKKIFLLWFCVPSFFHVRLLKKEHNLLSTALIIFTCTACYGPRSSRSSDGCPVPHQETRSWGHFKPCAHGALFLHLIADKTIWGIFYFFVL